MNLGPIDFELDAKKKFNILSSFKHDIIEFGMIIQKYKTIFTRYYINSSAQFVQRQANEATCKLV